MKEQSTEQLPKIENEKQSREVARNEPCPCGSRKKYKRCCGINAQPVLVRSNAELQKELTNPQVSDGEMSPEKLLQSMDQSKLNDLSVMMKRLPKMQLFKMQALMFKAMRGKDVTKDMAALEKMLPPEFMTLLTGMMPDSMKKEIEAQEAAGDIETSNEEKGSGVGGFWKKLTGKK